MGKKILVYRIGRLGDVLISIPAFWAIRKNYKNDHVTLLYDSNNQITPQEVLVNTSIFDDFMSYSPVKKQRKFLGLVSICKFLYTLRKKQFDTLVYLAPSRRSFFQRFRDKVFFRLAGIHEFIGFNGIWFSKKIKWEKPLAMVMHEADALLYRLSQSGIKTASIEKGNFDLAITKEEEIKVDKWLQSMIPVKYQNLVAFGPGSKMPAKRWPLTRFIEVGDYLIKKHNYYPIVFGGKEDKSIGFEMLQQWGEGLNAAGMLSIREATAALKRCDFYIGNDTGTMHLAVSAGIPCIAIFSARDLPGKWYPYGERHLVLRKTVRCEGCMLEICEEKQNLCLTSISVDEVLKQIECLLSERNIETSSIKIKQCAELSEYIPKIDK